ncbi:FAD-dependent oxidoreductase [Cellulomonas sp. JZ18]|uniref:FAD-dependent oxidoreductase n=1 Tax=Cellulomonas sp. JZ18 TaxID=2654191 RepID=UPI001E5402CF|nr:FAD-dependent oxidoreductase [Cellulomonas sp. JZ18]
MSVRRHDVVVVGGGNAGISLAAKLLRDGCRDVAVVEPKDVHHYRPLLSYVAGGTATLDDLTRPQVEVMPAACTGTATGSRPWTRRDPPCTWRVATS